MLRPTAGDKGRLAVPIEAALVLVLDAQRLNKTAHHAKGFNGAIFGLVPVQNDVNVTIETHVVHVAVLEPDGGNPPASCFYLFPLAARLTAAGGRSSTIRSFW